MYSGYDILYLLSNEQLYETGAVTEDNMTENEKLDLVLEKVTALDTKVEALDTKVEVLDTKVENLDKKVVQIENDVTIIKLTIENEIRVNIQRVAEGHLDLSRNLHECIELSNDVKNRQEIQDVYINMHNSKIRALEACQ